MVEGVNGGREVKEANTSYLLSSYCTDEIIVNMQESHFGGMVFTVGRLVRIK